MLITSEGIGAVSAVSIIIIHGAGNARGNTKIREERKNS